MKNLIAFVACNLLFMVGAFATNWWERPTICQPNNASCYPKMDVGFDPDEWDTAANCRGKKLVCPNAVIGGASFPTPFSKAELADNSLVSADFDTGVLGVTKKCFGSRRTKNNGSSAKVENDWVNVYCSWVLDAPDEVLDTGIIVLSTTHQPTCRSLAEGGVIGIINGQCFGKSGFPESDFFLECKTGILLPSLIAVLNGADNYRTSTLANPSASTYPVTEEIAAAMFSRMIDNAAEIRRKNAADALADAENE